MHKIKQIVWKDFPKKDISQFWSQFISLILISSIYEFSVKINTPPQTCQCRKSWRSVNDSPWVSWATENGKIAAFFWSIDWSASTPIEQSTFPLFWEKNLSCSLHYSSLNLELPQNTKWSFFSCLYQAFWMLFSTNFSRQTACQNKSRPARGNIWYMNAMK